MVAGSRLILKALCFMVEALPDLRIRNGTDDIGKQITHKHKHRAEQGDAQQKGNVRPHSRGGCRGPSPDKENTFSASTDPPNSSLKEPNCMVTAGSRMFRSPWLPQHLEPDSPGPRKQHIIAFQDVHQLFPGVQRYIGKGQKAQREGQEGLGDESAARW